MPIPLITPLLLKFPLLGRIPWRLVGVVVILLLAWWSIRSYADRVADEREGEIRALWKADTDERDRVAADQRTAATVRKADAADIGKEIDHELEAKYAAALRERDDLAGLLQRAAREVRACSSNRATDSLVAHDASEARRIEELRQLDQRYAAVVADLRTDAGLNADQLDAVHDFLRRQRVCPIRVE